MWHTAMRAASTAAWGGPPETGSEDDGRSEMMSREEFNDDPAPAPAPAPGVVVGGRVAAAAPPQARTTAETISGRPARASLACEYEWMGVGKV